MIEMVYNKKRIAPIVLSSGIYKEHKFAVINLGTHPTAYVECKFDDVFDYDDSRFNNVEVHWGLTYFGKDYWNKERDDNNYIGWDYAHAFDWLGYETDEVNEYCHNKKHTTREMTIDCLRAIDQLVETEEGH